MERFPIFWSITTVIEELQTHCPSLAQFIDTLEDSSDFPKSLQAHFHQLEPLSIDYALLEKTSQVLTMDADFDWNDLGNWTSAADYLQKDTHGNRSNHSINPLDAHNNIVFNKLDTHIALLGVDDLIVVNTEDALLIAHKNSAEKIKDLVDKTPRELH